MKPPRFLNTGAPNWGNVCLKLGPVWAWGGLWSWAATTCIIHILSEDYQSLLSGWLAGPDSWPGWLSPVTCDQPKGGPWNQTPRGELRTTTVPWAVSESSTHFTQRSWGQGGFGILLTLRMCALNVHSVLVAGSAVNTTCAWETRYSPSFMKRHAAEWKPVGPQASKATSFQESINWCYGNKMGILCTL